MSLKKSIVYSQCLRLKRLCSEQDDYYAQLGTLTGFFLDNGYPLAMIQDGIRKTSNVNRSDLISYKRKDQSTRIPLVFEYNVSLQPLTRAIKKDFAGLRGDPSLREIFPEPPVLAQRQPPNLRSILTSSRLRTNENGNGNRPCDSSRCQICRHISTESHIHLPNTEFTITPPCLSCNASNVIYLFFCNMCNDAIYVGETGTKFRLRFNNHKKSIRDNAVGFPVAEHYNLAYHSLANLKCIILATNFSTPDQRKRCEIKWILKLNSHVTGLNKDLGPLSRYNFDQNR